METLIQVEELSRKIEKIFPMPQTLMKINEALNNPNVNMARLEDILKSDPDFSFKLLSLANSAFYGSPNKVTNMHMAITLLGFNAIKNLAIQTSVQQTFGGDKPESCVPTQMIWKHSVGVAVCVKMLSRRLKLGNAEDFFTMGILHDLGFLIEAQFYSLPLSQMLERVNREKYSLTDLESEVLGMDHAQITHLLAEKWSLPKTLTTTLKHHHEPLDAPEENRRSASALYLADKIVMQAKYGFTYARAGETDEAVLALLQLEPVDMEVMLEDFQVEADQFAALLKQG
ncbi:MAG: HDOD domain-containing protein [Candidatus Firestonebacteria bacterium]|nr:HDOD domain-containing protein [Candidatus Firestonebacteria bacterium]